MRCFDIKTYCILSVIGDLMSKILHEYVFDIMQLLKKSGFGWVEKQYLQLNIKGYCMLCLMKKKTKHFIGQMRYMY